MTGNDTIKVGYLSKDEVKISLYIPDSSGPCSPLPAYLFLVRFDLYASQLTFFYVCAHP